MRRAARRTCARRVLLAALAVCGAALPIAPAPALAQPVDTGRIEVAGAARVLGAISFGDVPALETTPGGGTAPLFESNSRLEGSIGPAASIGVRLVRGLRAEAAVAYNSTHLSTRITGDRENVPDISVDTPVRQFMIEGGLVAQLRRWQAGPIAPFVTGGAGYVRQLYDGRTLVETGTAYYAGGGLYYERVAARPGLVKSAGLRVDVRALFMRDGVNLDDATHVTPLLTAGAFARF